MGVSGKSGSGTLHNLLPGVSHTLAFRLPCCLPLILRLGLVVVLRCGPIPAVDRKCLRQDATAIVDMLFVNSGGRSGLDVLRFIREDAGLRHLPIIVLTGFPLNHEVVARRSNRDTRSCGTSRLTWGTLRPDSMKFFKRRSFAPDQPPIVYAEPLDHVGSSWTIGVCTRASLIYTLT